MRVDRLLIVVCVFLTMKAAAQDQIVAKGDTLILPNGAKFWLNEQITLGSGSLQDKSFAFVFKPELPLINKRSPADANFAGQTGTIKKFQRDGAYKNSYSYNILVLDFNRQRLWCDIQFALSANEIVDNNSKSGQADSKQARLARLQKLLDSGQITKDEYETLKGKILSEKDSTPDTKKSSDAPQVF